MPDDQVGGNPSRCDGCRVFEHCDSICEDCEEKTTGACVDGCPFDCGVLDDGDEGIEGGSDMGPTEEDREVDHDDG